MDDANREDRTIREGEGEAATGPWILFQIPAASVLLQEKMEEKTEPDIGRLCGNCGFGDFNDARDPISDAGGAMVMMGSCHFDPPAPYIGWPAVVETGWCGKWKPLA